MKHDFSFHRDEVHNHLSYLYFIISIWLQRREDDNGVEIYVRKCLDNLDVTWFPINSFLSEFENDISKTKKDENTDVNQKNNDLIESKLATIKKTLIKKVEGQSNWTGATQSTSIGNNIRYKK